MLFNSISFFLFFIAVYLLYLLLRHQSQNKMLLAAGYFFYAAWDWRFLFLLLLSTVLDFVLAQKIERSRGRKKKILLALSITASLSILGFFKYFNFFASSFHELLAAIGIQTDFFTLRIILPVGVSFYTFQTIGYVTDVYRGKTPAVKNFLDFAVFVSFFPQLVAGPIERANHMIPQIQNPRLITAEKINDGLALFLWGLFKKTVIADNLAPLVERIFSDGAQLPGYLNLAGVYAFAFQIYGDFSGYTDMARGLAKLMGFDLNLNFNRPYLASNPPEFWQRWHISLSSWLRDYLYIPLGGNRYGKFLTYRNLMITMLLGGLWHGAAWTFVVWGAYHGLLLIIHKALPETKNNFMPRFLKIFFMFHYVCLGWIFFRAESLSAAFGIIRQIIFDFRINDLLSLFISWPAVLIFLALGGLLFILTSRAPHQNAASKWTLAGAPPAGKTFGYSAVLFLILLLGSRQAQQFIYFQF